MALVILITFSSSHSKRPLRSAGTQITSLWNVWNHSRRLLLLLLDSHFEQRPFWARRIYPPTAVKCRTASITSQRNGLHQPSHTGHPTVLAVHYRTIIIIIIIIVLLLLVLLPCAQLKQKSCRAAFTHPRVHDIERWTWLECSRRNFRTFFRVLLQ